MLKGLPTAFFCWRSLRKRSCNQMSIMDCVPNRRCAEAASSYPGEPFTCPPEKQPDHTMHPAGFLVGFQRNQVILVSDVVTILDGQRGVVPDHVGDALLISLGRRVEGVQLLRPDQQLI